MSVQKSRILNEAEINVLFVKANRFLSKENVKKEKGFIAKEVKAGFITGSGSKDARVYLRDGVLVESSEEDKGSDDGIDYSKVKKVAKMDDGSDFEDISSEEEPTQKKRGGKEDPRNRMYLQHYRETVEYEQSERYCDIKQSHTVDFTTPKGKKKLLEIEGLVRMTYKEQCVTKEDLELRDKVISNIKNAFKNCSDREFPQILTGELKISGFGSCQNGLWNVEHSDIDVTCVI